MVATLIRYEWLRTWRWLAVLVGGAALFVGAGALGGTLFPAPLNGVLGGAGMLVACGFPMVLPLLLGVDYYRSTFSRTGYFTVAIPARGATIFWVKIVYAWVITALGFVVAYQFVKPAPPSRAGPRLHNPTAPWRSSSATNTAPSAIMMARMKMAPSTP